MKKKNVNQAINLLKLIASFFVVFIHVHFPGWLGKFADCTARYAVPFFFIVSGYYSYNISIVRIKPRIIKLLKILSYSTIAYGLLRLYECLYVFGKDFSYFISYYFTKTNLFRFIVFGANPLGLHLWYLHSIIVVYLIYIFYIAIIRKRNKESFVSLYVISFILFTVMFILSLINEQDNKAVFIFQFRNAYLFGLPFFSVGLFLHQYNIKVRLKKIGFFNLLLLSLFFNFLALIQYKYFGKTDLPLGSAFVAVFVFLFGIKRPLLSTEKLGDLSAKCFDSVSLYMYLIHPLVKFWLIQLFNINLYLLPIVVITVSFALSSTYVVYHTLKK